MPSLDYAQALRSSLISEYSMHYDLNLTYEFIQLFTNTIPGRVLWEYSCLGALPQNWEYGRAFLHDQINIIRTAYWEIVCGNRGRLCGSEKGTEI